MEAVKDKLDIFTVMKDRHEKYEALLKGGSSIIAAIKEYFSNKENVFKGVKLTPKESPYELKMRYYSKDILVRVEFNLPKTTLDSEYHVWGELHIYEVKHVINDIGIKVQEKEKMNFVTSLEGSKTNQFRYKSFGNSSVFVETYHKGDSKDKDYMKDPREFSKYFVEHIEKYFSELDMRILPSEKDEIS